MKLINSEGRVYRILNSKNNVIAAWTRAIKPIEITMGDETVKVYGDPLRSNYIYFLYKGIARCVWAKDRGEFAFLEERKLELLAGNQTNASRLIPSSQLRPLPEESASVIAPVVSVTANSFNDLADVFKAQVAHDNKTFGIESIYLPNPRLTPDDPNYCLVAMEPSLAGMTASAFRDWVNRGYLNFVYYETDLILHYCAYNYLCDKHFKYHVTDISKGAMNTRLAVQHRNRRYAKLALPSKKRNGVTGASETNSCRKDSRRLSEKVRSPD